MRPFARKFLIALCFVATVTAGSVTAAPANLGPNLVSNPSFEESQFEPLSVSGQPILPVDWTVEGATILFDHSQNVYKDGRRGAAISGALGGGSQICDGSSGAQMCNPNPARPVTQELSLRPWWVTDAPIEVKAGATYHFSVFAIMPSLNPDAGVPGEGVATQVRWLAADGSELVTVDGPSLINQPGKRVIGWKQISADLVAPPGAAGAQLLLGHSDYTTTSTQVAFDSVVFAAA
ncbi:MAG TPA: hypothetical protein VMY88_12870 [Acidimicrobiales bacterium]|nr:hypothetical protein [Acidimicrobiales bacterium]